jgi:hypothetical protein
MLQLVPLVGPTSPEVEMVRCCACKSPEQINAQKAVARMKDDNGMQKDKFGCKTSSILARARAIYLVLGTENKNHKKTID